MSSQWLRHVIRTALTTACVLALSIGCVLGQELGQRFAVTGSVGYHETSMFASGDRSTITSGAGLDIGFGYQLTDRSGVFVRLVQGPRNGTRAHHVAVGPQFSFQLSANTDATVRLGAARHWVHFDLDTPGVNVSGNTIGLDGAVALDRALSDNLKVGGEAGLAYTWGSELDSGSQTIAFDFQLLSLAFGARVTWQPFAE